MTTRLAIVGGGRMGEALAGGLLSSGWAEPAELTIVEASPTRREELAQRLVGVALSASPVAADGVVLAVKPPDVAAACRAAVSAGVGRALSIAAGITIASLEAELGSIPVVRAMPNTPALVGAGVAAIAAGSHAGEADMAWAEGILGAVGAVVRVEESQLDAVTGLSGSGPAYVFLMVEALIEAGEEVGLAAEVSRELVLGTLLGSARLLIETGDTPRALRAAVTSPGGTTAAGIAVLEGAGMPQAVVDAVVAATTRATELGHG